MKREYWSVDRIENGTAVLENDQRQRTELPVHQLPSGVKEGDVLALENGEYRLDPEEAARRREEAIRLQNELFGDRPRRQ